MGGRFAVASQSRHAANARAGDAGGLEQPDGNVMAGMAMDRFGDGLRPLVWGGAACLLLAPAVAMWLGAEGVHWTGGDFLVMALLLGAAGGLFELGLRLDRRFSYRAGFWLATLAGFLTVWANLAVGMLGDEGHPANLLFAAVLALAVVGGFVARGRAAGMAKAMLAAGIAQLLIAAAALPMGFAPLETTLTALFALPWLAAAGLFAMAARVDGAGA